jgi:hypothetical protein
MQAILKYCNFRLHLAHVLSLPSETEIGPSYDVQLLQLCSVDGTAAVY